MTPLERLRPDPTRPLYVRRRKGRYQVRVWIGGRSGGYVNLGLYPSEEAASQAVKAVVRRLTGPLTPLAVWRAAAATGLMPAHVLPQHVSRRRDGAFDAVLRLPGGRVRIGPFADPEAAHRAAVGRLGGVA